MGKAKPEHELRRRTRICGGLRSAAFVLAFAASAPALAQADTDRAQQIVVTAPGGDIDRDDALRLDRADIDRAGRPDLLGALVRNLAGVTLQDVQGNPWQPTLVYRGYLASPLQGEAQGIAVYLDGGRFNQSFGDAVAFDLLPDAAIRNMTLLDSSPVFGLNALGGALVIETATGRSDPGVAMTLSGGSYGRREASMAAGGAGERFSWFVAGQNRREDGWRDHSPSHLANLFADVGLDAGDAGASTPSCWWPIPIWSATVRRRSTSLRPGGRRSSPGPTARAALIRAQASIPGWCSTSAPISKRQSTDRS